MSTVSPTLPPPAGPLSAAVIGQLSGRVRDLTRIRPAGSDPMGRDFQLTLYITYELSYRGFDGVDPEWEWDVDLIGLRARLERSFREHLQQCVGEIDGVSADSELDRLVCRPGGNPPEHQGPSDYLRNRGTWQQMREYFVHRSLHHLKDADPQTWVIPRLTGQAKAGLVAAEYDEYGAGDGALMHQQLFADLMSACGLDDGYLAYLDAVPAESLAVVNLMSMLGLHRSLRGAAVGHFAADGITAAPAARDLMQALHRLQAPQGCARYFGEADGDSDRVADVVTDLLIAEPELNDDVVFGIRARDIVEDRLTERLLTCWADGATSLLQPLP